jgi:nitrite reductase (cytochrome c-552)
MELRRAGTEDRMKKFARVAACTALLVLAVAGAACAPQLAQSDAAATPVDSQPAGGGNSAAVGSLDMLTLPNDAWLRYSLEYPNQVGSYYDGLDRVEGQDGKVHSHAMLYANTPVAGATNRGPGNLEKTGMACIACKSSDFNALYDEFGVAAYGLPWNDYKDRIQNWWDCGLCHEGGQPGAALTVGGGAAKLFGGTLLGTIDPKNAVCGQCHNAYGATYARGKFIQEAIAAGEVPAGADPYRYGYTPAGLKQAALEDGCGPREVDAATGIELWYANIGDIEFFQGSTHDMAGITCVDCHMQVRTSDAGEPYTSHNASSSPLERDESLEYCLSCHKAQGVGSAPEMRQFVLDAQAGVAARLDATEAALKQLYERIAAAVQSGSVSEATLEQARTNYEDAWWYRYFVQGRAELKGIKMVHNPQAAQTYLDDADALIAEAMALL